VQLNTFLRGKLVFLEIALASPFCRQKTPISRQKSQYIYEFNSGDRKADGIAIRVKR
jgi:hypothetical protein